METERNKRQIGKEKVKLYLVLVYMVIYIENTSESAKKIKLSEWFYIDCKIQGQYEENKYISVW